MSGGDQPFGHLRGEEGGRLRGFSPTATSIFLPAYLLELSKQTESNSRSFPKSCQKSTGPGGGAHKIPNLSASLGVSTRLSKVTDASFRGGISISLTTRRTQWRFESKNPRGTAHELDPRVSVTSLQPRGLAVNYDSGATALFTLEGC